MRVLLFYRERCPCCLPVMRHVAERYPGAELFDCDKPEGFGEAQGRLVASTPTVIACDDEGKEQWRARSMKELRGHENMEEEYEQREHCETCHC